MVELAKTALDVCDLDNPNRVSMKKKKKKNYCASFHDASASKSFQMTLCYILFSHHLKLGHNSDAYDAMIINPDQVSRLP